MSCNGFFAMVIILGTLASVGCSGEVPDRQAKRPTFEAEGMNHGAFAAEAPDGSADNGSALKADGGNGVLDPIWFPENQPPATPSRAPGVCFLVADGGDNEPASDRVFEFSDIHNCGELPNQNLVDPNPGGHALYLSEGLRTVVRRNLIHDNGARGVQLCNQTINSIIEGNMILDNGWGVAFDNDVTKAVVRGNIITENLKSNVSTAPTYSGSNNRVVDYCVWRADGDSGLGNIDPSVVVSGNVTADPRYDPFPAVTNTKCLAKCTGTLAR